MTNQTTNSLEKAYVFKDYSGKRWTKMKILFVTFVTLLTVLFTVIGISLFTNPNFTPLTIEETTWHSVAEPFEELPLETAVTPSIASTTTDFSTKAVYGFYTPNDVLRQQALYYSLDHLDVLIAQWYTLQEDLTLSTTLDEEAIQLTADAGVQILPSVQISYLSTLTDPLHQQQVAQNLLETVQQADYSGLHIDFANLLDADRQTISDFFTLLATLFQQNGLTLSFTGSTQSAIFDYEYLAQQVDFIVFELFYEHYTTSKSGPIASINWSQEILQQLPIPAEKMVLGVSSFGLEWPESQTTDARYVDYAEIMYMAQTNELQVQWDTVSRNPYIRYEKDGIPYVLWFIDATTIYNQLATAHAYSGIAIYDMGMEDPSIWSLFDTHFKPNDLANIPIHYPVTNIGKGEFIQMTRTTQEGTRKLILDDQQLIQSAHYTHYPQPYYIKRTGKQSKKLVLSFDDGPDPQFTPQILDILSAKKVPATFFILGIHGLQYPAILERIVREGHEVGNHTFTHSDIKTDSFATLQMELNATQYVIEQATGRSTTLFRPPFTTDLSYTTEEVRPISYIEQMGYTMVASHIDTRDWTGQSQEDIIAHVLAEAESGNFILLHDSGGNRTATVDALPELIDALRDAGYELVSAASLLNQTTDEVMPPIPSKTNYFLYFYQAISTLFIGSVSFFKVLFAFGIGLGIVRVLFFLCFSFKHKRSMRKRMRNPFYTPFITVIIPAYNEQSVIAKTIHSVLDSDYPHFEVLVIDDGSIDDTAQIVQNTFSMDGRVRLIKKQNGGKSSCINLGCEEALGEIIVTMDADTGIDKQALSLLVEHFADATVGAVSGNVKIGNVRNLLTLWQHVEYVSGFNLEKRSFHELNCITVVPGALGAWRKEAIMEVQLFEDDTLAEDTDMTIKLLRVGYRVHFEAAAYAYTEAPEDVSSFLKQRFRWSYGILQCLWKHRGAIGQRKQKTLGFIGLPNMWLQYGFQAISPLMDAIFLIGLLANPKFVLTFYLLFLLADYLVAIYAFRLERLSLKPLLLLFLQRVVYRFLLTITIWRAFILCSKGAIIGWNKLNRSGNVEMPDLDR